MAEFEQGELDQLLEYRKALVGTPAINKSALESIVEWMSDASGGITLSETNQKVFDRMKEIYKMKLDGKTNSQIVMSMHKFSGYSENTIRSDIKNLGKVFPSNLDVDVEMTVLYERNQQLISRLTGSNNPKMLSQLAKLHQIQKDILLYFKGDSNLPDPELFKPNIFIITTNPKDIGLDDDVPSMEELKRKYKSKTIAETIEVEEI